MILRRKESTLQKILSFNPASVLRGIENKELSKNDIIIFFNVDALQNIIIKYNKNIKKTNLADNRDDNIVTPISQKPNKNEIDLLKKKKLEEIKNKKTNAQNGIVENTDNISSKK